MESQHPFPSLTRNFILLLKQIFWQKFADTQINSTKTFSVDEVVFSNFARKFPVKTLFLEMFPVLETSRGIIANFYLWSHSKDWIQSLRKAMRVFPSTCLPLSGSFRAATIWWQPRNSRLLFKISSPQLTSFTWNKSIKLAVYLSWLLNFSAVFVVPRAAS